MRNDTTKARLAAATAADPRWAAVVARDAAADGTFYYSVATTGVYCRPSCGARLARPEHVRFHASCAAAEQAGFRPCKRCRPEQLPLNARHAATITEACRLIETAEDLPRLDALARHAGVSRYHFHRMFKRLVGLTPAQYAAAFRDRRLRELLGRSATVTQAIADAGYGSHGRFYARTNAILGMTPTAYRAGGADADIRYAVGTCTLGAILVAHSGRGVCAISLGDDPDALVRELQERFPQAVLIGGDSEFERLVATVVGFVDAPQLGLELPLDIRGTAFQRRVWQALREIAPGTTQSYTDIAARIGAPAAVRAVARACAANPLAVAIPCHRAVRRDGGLSGYRWGVERKRALLDREGQQGHGERPVAAPYPRPRAARKRRGGR